MNCMKINHLFKNDFINTTKITKMYGLVAKMDQNLEIKSSEGINHFKPNRGLVKSTLVQF